jgi:hypothetical protein
MEGESQSMAIYPMLIHRARSSILFMWYFPRDSALAPLGLETTCGSVQRNIPAALSDASDGVLGAMVGVAKTKVMLAVCSYM